jgi:predicted enzyme related to lactoylglutathione lyase
VTGPDVRVSDIGIDANDVPAMARFWAAVTGYDSTVDGDDYVFLSAPSGTGPNVFVQRVPEPKVGKNRLHLDLRSSNLASATRELLSLGAEVVQHHESGDDVWTVFADPEGNQFCIIQGS